MAEDTICWNDEHCDDGICRHCDSGYDNDIACNMCNGEESGGVMDCCGYENADEWLKAHPEYQSKSKVEIGLCGPGRHEMPVSEFIYPFMVDNPVDFTANEAITKEWLFDLDEGVEEIHLYVTGLSPVLTSFLNAWMQAVVAPDLYLYHFNRDSGDYEVQKMFY